MKTALAALAALTLLSGTEAWAGKGCPGFSIGGSDPNTRWADRCATRDADFVITTEDGAVSLLLVDGVVAMQLSDRSMKKVHRELKDEQNEAEDNAFARAIKSAVLNGVRSLLDHSLECRVRDLRSVSYRNDRLVFVTNDGDRIFEKIEVDDRDALASFSPEDARAFVAEFRRAKNRQRS